MYLRSEQGTQKCSTNMDSLWLLQWIFHFFAEHFSSKEAKDLLKHNYG
jgi:hypothetical protein